MALWLVVVPMFRGWVGWSKGGISLVERRPCMLSLVQYWNCSEHGLATWTCNIMPQTYAAHTYAVTPVDADIANVPPADVLHEHVDVNMFCVPWACRLLDRERDQNGGKYPETIALVLWGTDNIKTYGESLAQVRS